jgi:uncharacterized lipoprotein NlpE involved in copper resistance
MVLKTIINFPQRGIKMKKAFFFWFISLIISFTLFNCSKQETSTDPPAPICDQACQDEHVAYGLIDIFWFVWNQNISGQPAGAKDFTVAGPQGGTIHVTGTTEVSASTGINTLHLVLVMSDCKGLKEKYNLTINGTVTADGTFSTTHKAITYASQQLGYTGTVGKDDWVTNVTGTCNVTVNETFSSVSGTFCNRTFSY